MQFQFQFAVLYRVILMQSAMTLELGNPGPEVADGMGLCSIWAWLHSAVH